MSVLVRFTPTNVTKDEVRAEPSALKEAGELPPEGMEYHVAFGPEANMRVSEIWGSREQLQAFALRLMPILAEVGIEFSDEPESSTCRTSSGGRRAPRLGRSAARSPESAA